MAVYVCLLMERVTGNFRLQEVATSSLIVSGSLVRVPCVNLLGSVCGYLSPRNLVARYMADLGGVTLVSVFCVLMPWHVNSFEGCHSSLRNCRELGIF